MPTPTVNEIISKSNVYEHMTQITQFLSTRGIASQGYSLPWSLDYHPPFSADAAHMATQLDTPSSVTNTPSQSTITTPENLSISLSDTYNYIMYVFRKCTRIRNTIVRVYYGSGTSWILQSQSQNYAIFRETTSAISSTAPAIRNGAGYDFYIAGYARSPNNTNMVINYNVDVSGILKTNDEINVTTYNAMINLLTENRDVYDGTTGSSSYLINWSQYTCHNRCHSSCHGRSRR